MPYPCITRRKTNHTRAEQNEHRKELSRAHYKVVILFFMKQDMTSLKHQFQVCTIHTHYLAEESYFQKSHTKKKKESKE